MLIYQKWIASRQLVICSVIATFSVLALLALFYGYPNTSLIFQSNNYSDVYNVRLLPVSLSDTELDQLPKTSFSYLAMIDAGSSGCRVHVYRYGKLGNMDGPLYVLPKHISLKAKPGLSSFAANPTGAGESLAPLIAFLKENVPAEYWNVTPIWLKATAGLRMLSSKESDAILNDVREFLLDKANSPFLFLPSYARIISGKEEGAFGWVAFNYLKQIIGPRKHQPLQDGSVASSQTSTPTTGTVTPPHHAPYVVVEMGGASSQVTQRLPHNPDSARSGNIRSGTNSGHSHHGLPLDNAYSFHIEDEYFELYTYSYLGYGSEQAREKLNHVLLKDIQSKNREPAVDPLLTVDVIESPKKPENAAVIHDVCLNNGFRREKGVKRNSVYEGSDTNDYTIVGNAGEADHGLGCYDAMAKHLKNSYVANEMPSDKSNSANLRAAAGGSSLCMTSDGKTKHVVEPASFDCVHQPHFVVESSNFLVFENFFYATSAANVLTYNHKFGLLSKDLTATAPQYPLLTSPLEIKESAAEVCKLEYDKELLVHYPRDAQPKDVATKLCFTLSYAAAFLIEGLHIPENKVLTIQKEVEGNEVEWALGAAYKEASDLVRPRYPKSA
jgi:apyrase